MKKLVSLLLVAVMMFAVMATASAELLGPGNVTLKRLGYTCPWDVNADYMVPIMKEATDTVVICGCIQDAEALQRANGAKNENVIFTGFVGDKLDRVDFSPLNEKNVVFLISNHNGMSMADAYFEAEKVYQYLTKPKRGKKKLIIPEFAFVQRQVEYPDSSTIGTPKDLASVYYHNRPKINPQATFPKIPLMDESDFTTMLAKIRKSPADSSHNTGKALTP